jgi:hypothetical protein
MRLRQVVSSIGIAVLVTAIAIGVGTTVSAETKGIDGPEYDAQGKLIRPANYREWVNIGTGIGMVYGPLRDKAGGNQAFTNVFVNPSSYRAFLTNGAWPDKTLFVLEIRHSTTVNNSTTGNNGRFQGDVMGIEAHVKDESRFETGWAFFNLSLRESSGSMIPTTASCYSCHATNAAVDNTFVQFYPELRDVAKKHGTFKAVPEVF